MDVLLGLFCLPIQPTLDVTNLKRANFNTLLEKSIVHSSEIMKNSALKREVSDCMTTSLNNKSHSMNNTKKTIQLILEMAIQTRKTNKEKDLLRWLQFCIDTCLSQQQQQQQNIYIKDEPISNNNNNNKINHQHHHHIPQKSNHYLMTTGFEKKISNKNIPSTTTIKNNNNNNNNKNKNKNKNNNITNKKKKDESISYHVIGDSDDDGDFVPLKNKKENDDQLVPGGDKTTTTTKKVQRKRRPKVEYTPLFKDGAGTNVVTNYFLKYHQEANISKKGHFAKSYFFPSEESFNAFSSVLRSAQKTIDICIFSMTDNDVANILIAAKQRKVNVRIITDNKQIKIKGANAERLHYDHKIPYKTNHSSSYMHHKFAIVDSKILINGSFNWSINARTKNQDNIIISNLPFCIEEFQGQFDTLWKTF